MMSKAQLQFTFALSMRNNVFLKSNYIINITECFKYVNEIPIFAYFPQITWKHIFNNNGWYYVTSMPLNALYKFTYIKIIDLI